MNQKVYIGIDLTNEYAMVSYQGPEDEEIKTISVVPDTEKYKIPLMVYEARDGKIYYGDSAKKQSRSGDNWGMFHKDILFFALNESDDENTYTELLINFIKRLIKLYPGGDVLPGDLSICITVDKIDKKILKLFDKISKRLRMQADEVYLCDRAESFYSYVVNGNPNLYIHDTALFYFKRTGIECIILHQQNQGKQKVFTSGNKSFRVDENSLKNLQKRDIALGKVINECFTKKVVSTVYFIGDSFDGDWMKEAIKAIGSNKKAFMGKNLFSTGAVYRAKQGNAENEIGYFGSYKLLSSLVAAINVNNVDEKVVLASAGENWFDVHKEFYVIYDDDPTIKLTIVSQKGNRTAEITLDNIPERPSKTIRLHISVTAENENNIIIKIKDIGFGELYKSSMAKWEYKINLE